MPSWSPFELIAAVRFLREGRMQTLLIIGGVAIGVAVIVFMSVLLAGMQANIINRTLSAQAHIVVLPPEEVARPLREREAPIVQKPSQRIRSIDQWLSVRDQVARMPGVVAVAAEASGPALVVRGDASRSVSAIGIEPEAFFRIIPLPDKLVSGSLAMSSQDIVIGTELAKDLGVQLGDKLRVSSGLGNAQVLTIRGVVDLGSKGANERNVYVLMRTGQTLQGLIGGVSAMDVDVGDVYAAERVAQAITAASGLEADSWIHTNAQFVVAINAQTIANRSIRFFVGLSVAFGIASVLVVSVVQRSKEIGILRAMGGSRGQILRVFLAQGAILGFLGSLAGCGLACLFLVGWIHIARNADGTPLFVVIWRASLFLWSAALATVTGIAAAIMPARRAARLDPVEAIRG
jgi:lipoprotein-releasing system permease protein